jgi:hypothetical protein
MKPLRDNNSSSENYSHAVCRSSELLSCARTALKVAKNRYAKQQQLNPSNKEPEWYLQLDPTDLHLHDCSSNSNNGTDTRNGAATGSSPLEGGLSILRTMDSELKHLETLVRRRGQSNDPALEIQRCVQNLEEDAKELNVWVQTIVPHRANQQRQRHWKTIQQWFQDRATAQSRRLKDVLAVRGTVLEEQARRRKRFAVNTHRSQPNASAAASAAANALFSVPPPSAPAPVASAASNGMSHWAQSGGGSFPSMGSPANATSHSAPASVNSANALRAAPMAAAAAADASGPGRGAYAYYGSASATRGGYGGFSNPASAYGGTNAQYHAGANHATLGMRQRRTGDAANGHESSTFPHNNSSSNNQQQQQLELRQQERQSVQRLQEARLAEQSLAELGTVFGKMSTVLQQQSETINNIEDDVEAAQEYVQAGHNEITILYELKKGNRPLILKTFALLNFLIVFMRFYVKK